MDSHSLKQIENIYAQVDSCAFDIKRCGSFYDREKTVFRVFAPTSRAMSLWLNGCRYSMEKTEGSFECIVYGDHEREFYHYENSEGKAFRDPFSYASNQSESIVLDRSKFISEKITLPECKCPSITEVSVRDFSSSGSYTGDFRKKFLAFTEDGLNYHGEKIGIDYLCELGVTHIQLLPVFDFDDDKKSGSDYNWGYNPLGYFSLKDSYLCSADDSYMRVNEFRMMVNHLHRKGLRVVLDVVFNHMYNDKTSDLGKMIPHYFFRYRKNGKLANGTWCGNELRTEGKFARAFFVEMCRRYAEIYDIDGLRFDLMGIMDIDTINEIVKEVRNIKKDFCFYGEGWNMGEALSEDKRASIGNLHRMTDVGAFNDVFRDNVIAFTLGDESKKSIIAEVMNGSTNFGFPEGRSINYVECHDGFTYADRLEGESEEMKIKRVRLSLGIVAMSKGIPFISMGEEFLRNKRGVSNSYCSPDSINQIDYSLLMKYKKVSRSYSDLLKVRSMIDFSEEANFRDYYECLVEDIGQYTIIVNPCPFDHIYRDENDYEIIYDGEKCVKNESASIIVPSYSICVCRKVLMII